MAGGLLKCADGFAQPLRRLTMKFHTSPHGQGAVRTVCRIGTHGSHLVVLSSYAPELCRRLLNLKTQLLLNLLLSARV
jgi:hypothetical protein